VKKEVNCTSLFKVSHHCHEDSSLLGHGTVSTGIQLLMFQRDWLSLSHSKATFTVCCLQRDSYSSSTQSIVIKLPYYVQ